jgi:GDP-4-dehydro-6-deoxy-D-mannose reductase
MGRCLITGSAGFIGSALAPLLVAAGHHVVGLVHRRSGAPLSGVDVAEADLCDRAAVARAVRGPAPRWVFHLAAQDNIRASWTDPSGTIRTNVEGTLNLFHALHAQSWASPPTVVVVGSSAEYGHTALEEMPIREDHELRPSSPYGVSKVAEDLLARALGARYEIPVVRVRPFYVTGPGKDDACAGFARQLVALKGSGGTVMAGNLEAVRDLVDVRDAAEALVVLAAAGTPGDVYNLCSGVARTMREILGLLIDASGLTVDVAVDPGRVRANEDYLLVGNNAKLTALGWRPRITARQTMHDILDYWCRVPAPATAERTRGPGAGRAS